MRPSGMSVHPTNLNEAPETTVLFEYVTVTGSYIPTFELLYGQKITLPDGRRVPPLN